jgi:hypothetical protein
MAAIGQAMMEIQGLVDWLTASASWRLVWVGENARIGAMGANQVRMTAGKKCG